MVGLCEVGTVQGLGDTLMDKKDMVSALTEPMNSIKQHKLALFTEESVPVALHLLTTQCPRSLSRLCLSTGPQDTLVLNIGDP